MAANVPLSDAAFRKSSYSYLRESQRYLHWLKGRAADKAIVERYGDEEQSVELDPDTPTDVEDIMRDIVDIHKQISIYKDKIGGKDNYNFRDSGVCECSDRNSVASTGEFPLTNAVENREDHDIPAYIIEKADAAKNSRPGCSETPRSRQNVDETDKTD